jgi:hypothetical protein
VPKQRGLSRKVRPHLQPSSDLLNPLGTLDDARPDAMIASARAVLIPPIPPPTTMVGCDMIFPIRNRWALRLARVRHAHRQTTGDQIRGFFGDGDHGRVGITPDDARHYRRINHPQSVDAENP